MDAYTLEQVRWVWPEWEGRACEAYGPKRPKVDPSFSRVLESRQDAHKAVAKVRICRSEDKNTSPMIVKRTPLVARQDIQELANQLTRSVNTNVKIKAEKLRGASARVSKVSSSLPKSQVSIVAPFTGSSDAVNRLRSTYYLKLSPTASQKTKSSVHDKSDSCCSTRQFFIMLSALCRGMEKKVTIILINNFSNSAVYRRRHSERCT
jgi:hypothetical protein